ncbi:Chaperone protein DnaJ [Ananas comosus]|uniref:Chaperone protein DnaJ n=1 Tax=Ananas comosus TaxID=4615 RepID=A0A199UCU5_ANACO|nr:Chaperone protein DnaJ [Ananas comosus]
MARKGGQHKNGLNRNVPSQKGKASEPLSKQKPKTHERKIVDTEPLVSDHGAGGFVENDIVSDVSTSRGDDEIDFSFDHNRNEGENLMDQNGSSYAVASQRLRAFLLYLMKNVNGWIERQRPYFSAFTTILCKGCTYVRKKFEHVHPVIWTWMLYFGKLVLLISMVWLDCSIRGLDSLLRMGTTSFFTVLWCSFLSVSAMIGFVKMLVVMVIAALVAAFIGLGLAIMLTSIIAITVLWIYGSFWTTALVILLGGASFALSHERIALLVTTLYSMYCARGYLGWLGLIMGLNLSFISSDVLVHFLKNYINEQKPSEQGEPHNENQGGEGHFYAEPFHSSQEADRSAGVPSTSGSEKELTSEEEVVRLLNCTDHYSALGLPRYENIDVSLLKKEYKRKAMLVHPDKNMGNEKAAEAFKKLQNAYEVLLDSLKRKMYDDELRREELINYFRRFQNASQKKGRHGNFRSGFGHSEVDGEGPRGGGESRRIACKKCGNFHLWIWTERTKSQARWCQMDQPCAYVCAGSRIYDVTEWFICQGMRCPANTHKPSFHVNTNLTKLSNSKGSRMQNANLDETMTEEEFFEWLQNAVQSGAFESFSTESESPSAQSGSCSKSGLKKKRKGKKQW